jgi:hypothetical protein
MPRNEDVNTIWTQYRALGLRRRRADRLGAHRGVRRHQGAHGGDAGNRTGETTGRESQAMTPIANLSTHCLRTSRSSQRCRRCGASLAEVRAHVPLKVAGVYCAGCCPACNQPPTNHREQTGKLPEGEPHAA